MLIPDTASSDCNPISAGGSYAANRLPGPGGQRGSRCLWPSVPYSISARGDQPYLDFLSHMFHEEEWR